MYRTYNGNRLLNRIADSIIHGPDSAAQDEDGMSILNFSDYEVVANIKSDDKLVQQLLIYPYVMQKFRRLKKDQHIEISGVSQNNEPYNLTLTRKDFKRRMNVIYGKFDETKFISFSVSKLWLQMIIDQSDIIWMKDGHRFQYKSNDEIKGSKVMYIIIISLFVTIILFVSLLILMFSLDKILWKRL